MATRIVILLCAIAFLGNAANAKVMLKLSMEDGYEMVRLATAGDNMDMVKMLIKQGCSVNRPAGSKSKSPTPLHIAVVNDNLPMIKLLVAENADSKARAIMAKELDGKKIPMCKYLLKEGPSRVDYTSVNSTKVIF